MKDTVHSYYLDTLFVFTVLRFLSKMFQMDINKCSLI